MDSRARWRSFALRDTACAGAHKPARYCGVFDGLHFFPLDILWCAFRAVVTASNDAVVETLSPA
jgi:hypothetical protein